MIIQNRAGRTESYYHTETITSGSTGQTIEIPTLPAGKNITCTLIAGASTGKFQFTTSYDFDTNSIPATATWQDWALGNKTGTISDAIISPVTAIRGVSVSGAIVIEIVI